MRRFHRIIFFKFHSTLLRILLQGVDQNTKSKFQEPEDTSKHLRRSLDILKKCGEYDVSIQRKYEKLLKSFQDWQNDLSDDQSIKSAA